MPMYVHRGLCTFVMCRHKPLYLCIVFHFFTSSTNLVNKKQISLYRRYIIASLISIIRTVKYRNSTFLLQQDNLHCYEKLHCLNVIILQQKLHITHVVIHVES